MELCGILLGAAAHLWEVPQVNHLVNIRDNLEVKHSGNTLVLLLCLRDISQDTKTQWQQFLTTLHPGSELLPQGLMAQMGQTPAGLCHSGGDLHISRSPATPIPSREIDFKALEDRLQVAFAQKLETIAKDLKASWTSPMRSSPVDPTLESGSSTSARLPPGSSAKSTHTVDDQHQPVDTAVGCAVQPSTLPIKAKPPLPPQTIQSTSQQQDIPYLRDPLPHRETLSSRRTRSRSRNRHRKRPRSRSPSHRFHHGNYDRKSSNTRQSQSASSSRPGPPVTAYRPSSSSTRNFAHPIYARSTMSRRSSPPTRSIRMRSRSPEHRTRHRTTRGLFEREPGVHIQAKARPRMTRSRSGTPQPEPEPPQAFDESFEMQIPSSMDIPLADWSQLSPEHPDHGQEDDEPIVQEETIWQDRQTMVKTAYEDPSRTRATCELVHDGILCLTQKVRTRKYKKFLSILHTRNPGTPRLILGNMASIFAQSGKMTRKQAKGSYTFKVSDTCGYGLLVPTLFGQKPGFQDDTSIKYYIIHGTTSIGASRTLAEDLLRPGEVTFRPMDIAQ